MRHAGTLPPAAFARLSLEDSVETVCARIETLFRGYPTVVQIAVIKAPSVLGLRPTGVERLPAALEAAGLLSGLPIAGTTLVEPPPYNPEREPSGVLNARSLSDYSRALADAVGRALAGERFALVLGGDCSILLGATLALKRRGRFGLFFMDGHADFYQPEASATGEAADMDLALVTGRGPRLLTGIEDRGPYVRDDNVVQFGQRDREETLDYGSRQIQDTAIRVFDAETILSMGVAEATRQALRIVTRPRLSGFWIHLDVDVIDDAQMPAVDYRQPGGLPLDEVGAALRALLASGRAVGLSVAIFNPALDPAGDVAARLAACLRGAFIPAWTGAFTAR